MAVMPNIEITYEFEPVVKVLCTAVNCRFNLMNHSVDRDKQAACGLKHIVIGYQATCKMFEKIIDIQDNEN